jgi:cyclohexa-1,5-dienecarbonyl-CoA hydratase
MSYNFIKLDIDNRAGYLTINKPPYNVLDIPMMKEINDALDKLQNEDLNILVINSAGEKAFSAGVDVADHTEDKVDEMIEVFHGIFKKLNKLPYITLAAVKGAALGGGCELALFCDLIVCADNLKIGQPEIKLAVFPPIALLMLSKMIPEKRAFEVILGGETFNAQQAYDMGLVNKVVPLENFDEELANYVKIYTKMSGSALKVTKEAFGKVRNLSFEQGLPVIEDLYMNKLMKLGDAEEGLKSFMEKRKPQWKHN